MSTESKLVGDALGMALRGAIVVSVIALIALTIKQFEGGLRLFILASPMIAAVILFLTKSQVNWP